MKKSCAGKSESYIKYKVKNEGDLMKIYSWLKLAGCGSALAGLMVFGIGCGGDEGETTTILQVVTNAVDGTVTTNVVEVSSEESEEVQDVVVDEEEAALPDVAGEWNGIATDSETRTVYHLELDLEQNEDTVTGQFLFVNTDEGFKLVGNAHGVLSGSQMILVLEGSSMLRMRMAGKASYVPIHLSGTVNAAATSYTGSWDHGPFALQK